MIFSRPKVLSICLAAALQVQTFCTAEPTHAKLLQLEIIKESRPKDEPLFEASVEAVCTKAFKELPEFLNTDVKCSLVSCKEVEKRRMLRHLQTVPNPVDLQFMFDIVGLTAEQQKQYENLVKELLEKIRDHIAEITESIDVTVHGAVWVTGTTLPDPTPPGVMGDPHFKTWTGHLYDFHGACDLVLVHSKNFGEGLGLDIHVRTEMRDDWSFVAAAAIKIGKDTLEVGGFGRYYFNGIEDANIDTISGFPIQHRRGGKNQSMFIVELGEKGKIYVKVYKDLLGVSVSDTTGEHFGDAVGLMGEFKTGNMIGRDGETVFDKDPSAYGLDWQVRDTELVLFHEVKGPQYPVQCTMPPPISEKRRRLQASSVSYEEAERACAEWSGLAEKDLCISDVMVTGDLGMAQAGAF